MLWQRMNNDIRKGGSCTRTLVHTQEKQWIKAEIVVSCLAFDHSNKLFDFDLVIFANGDAASYSNGTPKPLR